jgi:hypothetical protein
MLFDSDSVKIMLLTGVEAALYVSAKSHREPNLEMDVRID